MDYDMSQGEKDKKTMGSAILDELTSPERDTGQMQGKAQTNETAS